MKGTQMHPIRDEITVNRTRLFNKLVISGLKRATIESTFADIDRIIGLEKAFIAEVIMRANKDICDAEK